MVFEDPTWDALAAELGKAIRAADQKTAHDLNAAHAALSRFPARGGKPILHHGWNDPALAALDSIDYYKSVLATMGAQKADGFVRFYMVPGMQHRVGGPGATWFGQLGTVIAKGPQKGIYDALEPWVEKGTKRGVTIGTKYPGDNPGKPATMTHPLCPYPEAAKYKGPGDTSDDANFECVEPAK